MFTQEMFFLNHQRYTAKDGSPKMSLQVCDDKGVVRSFFADASLFSSYPFVLFERVLVSFELVSYGKNTSMRLGGYAECPPKSK